MFVVKTATWTLLLSGCLCLAAFAATQENTFYTKEFGEHVGQKVENGFLFIDGRYIEAPYVVTRKGLAVLINDVVISRLAKPDDPWIEEEPKVEAPITKKTTIDEFFDAKSPFKNVGIRKWIFMHQHFPPNVATKQMVDFYRSLPFVKNITFDVEDAGTIIIETFSGEKQHIQVGPPLSDKVLKRSSTKDIQGEIEARRLRFENRLQQGDCFFLFTKAPELSFGRTEVAEDLRLIVDILRSKRSAEEKRSLLERLSALPLESEDLYLPLYTQFTASKQFDQRIQAVIDQAGVTPKTFEDIPSEPPADVEMRRAKEATRKRLEEERKSSQKGEGRGSIQLLSH